MAEIKSKRAFEQLGEINYAVQKLQKTYTSIKERYQQGERDQARAAEQLDKIAAAGKLL